MKKTTTGFTLVELLIVIVVIAILAAISIVAYTGIQQRARDSSMLSDLSQVSRQLELYYAEQGAYPINTAQAATLPARFSFSPTGTNVLLCSNVNGYTVFARHPSAAARQFKVASGGSPERLVDTMAWGTAATMCANTPYPATAWGSHWIDV